MRINIELLKMNPHKLILLFFVSLLTFVGCDSVYKYVFVPVERTETILVPDMEVIKALNDTTFRFSKDGNTIIWDKKDYKIEFKFISDYQLNNFEFPEDSKSGEYSKNPFTYGDWVDPVSGFTPNRFSVFKISIYNYSGSKLNFDPEEALLETDRGDRFKAYGREKKDSKYQSIEQYFLKRKGASGVDDDVFESRMGIARRTMVFMGKPIYAGDSKEGFVVFDPVVESVDKIKITLNKFILGYDENNQPASFTDIVFYFKKVPFDKSLFENRTLTTDTSQSKSTISKVDQKDKFIELNVSQLQYTSTETHFQGEVWNPYPTSIPNMLEFASRNIKILPKFNRTIIEEKSIEKSKLVILLGGFAKPEISSSMITTLGKYLSQGGFIFIDNSYVTKDWPYLSTMKEFFDNISKSVNGKVEIKKIPLNHEIFNNKIKFSSLPKGYDDFSGTGEKYDYIEGMFIDGKLSAILSGKGYIAQWVAAQNSEESLNFATNIINYIVNKK